MCHSNQFMNMKTWRFFYRITTKLLNQCLDIYLFFFMAPSLRVPSWSYFTYLLFDTGYCAKERVAGRTESTYEDMPITGVEKAQKREDKRGATAASPTSVWKENTFLSHSLPVCRISLFESWGGDTHRHRHAETHTGNLMMKVVGLKRAFSRTVNM